MDVFMNDHYLRCAISLFFGWTLPPGLPLVQVLDVDPDVAWAGAVLPGAGLEVHLAQALRPAGRPPVLRLPLRRGLRDTLGEEGRGPTAISSTKSSPTAHDGAQAPTHPTVFFLFLFNCLPLSF